jgi:short chain dehydrogenase
MGSPISRRFIPLRAPSVLIPSFTGDSVSLPSCRSLSDTICLGVALGFGLAFRDMPTWLVIGASRGIGFEFVRQLTARGDQVIATVRNPMNAAELWALIGTAPLGACRLLLCDVASEQLIAVTTVPNL